MKQLISLLICAALSTAALAQLPGGLGGGKVNLDLGVDALFKKGPAITTSLKDAKWEAPEKDGFNPPTSPFKTLERGTNGGFLLKEGAFEGTLQSYCLHAGTHGPGKGEAYLYAPPKGPYEKAVIALVQNSVKKPEVPQRKIQMLLWAMMARTKFSDLGRDLQAVAAQLLTAKQIADLNGGALAFISDELMERGLIKQPPLMRQIMEAENQLRRAFANPASAFDDFERIAVLTGDIPWGDGSVKSPRGRWSAHPDGYFVRYIPYGYSHTQVTVYVPAGSKAIGKEFDPATHIAVPGDTARQRLLQSARFYE